MKLWKYLYSNGPSKDTNSLQNSKLDLMWVGGIYFRSRGSVDLAHRLKYAIETARNLNRKWNFVTCRKWNSRGFNEVLLHVKKIERFSKIFQQNFFTRDSIMKMPTKIFYKIFSFNTIERVLMSELRLLSSSSPSSTLQSQKACKIYWTFSTSSCLNVESSVHYSHAFLFYFYIFIPSFSIREEENIRKKTIWQFEQPRSWRVERWRGTEVTAERRRKSKEF